MLIRQLSTPTRQQGFVVPKKTDARWIDVIREIAENEPSMSAAAIGVRLSMPSIRATVPHDAGEPPTERTVQRILRSHQMSPDGERKQYRYVTWPKTFIDGLLPRESTRTVLDEVARWHRSEGRRITVRWARWYWLLCEATGEEVPLRDRELRTQIAFTAGALSAMEVLGGPSSESLQAVEAWLAYRGWSTEQEGLTAGEIAYIEAVNQDRSLDWVPLFNIPGGTRPEVAHAASVEFLGERATQQIEDMARATPGYTGALGKRGADDD